MIRKYETIYIVKPDLAEEDLKALTDKVQDVIAGNNGELKRLEDWGIRKLAYAIKKSPRGRYVYLRYDGVETLVAELERRLRLDDRILRYLTVKIEKETVAPVVAEVPEEEEGEATTELEETEEESA
jgi:small subunit ribosomal protein S6